MKPPSQVVYLVDNDVRGREAVSGALQASSMNVIGFRSGSEYLEHNRTDDSSCLILDLHLPDMSGLDLQRRLLEKANPPVIFVSGQCDIPSTVRAMKAGAIEFLSYFTSSAVHRICRALLRDPLGLSRFPRRTKIAHYRASIEFC